MVLPSPHQRSPTMANQQYTKQFKRDAVKLMTEQGYRLSKATA
jgi:transposase-like protein